MSGAGRRSGERGSILLELLFLMVVITIPLFYLVATLAQAQAGAFAANAAAREAGRAFVTAGSDDAGYARALAAGGIAVGSHGVDERDLDIQVSCAATPCLTPGASIQIDVVVHVGLPLVPDFVSGSVPARVTLAATHVEVVDEFQAGR